MIRVPDEMKQLGAVYALSMIQDTLREFQTETPNMWRAAPDNAGVVPKEIQADPLFNHKTAVALAQEWGCHMQGYMLFLEGQVTSETVENGLQSAQMQLARNGQEMAQPSEVRYASKLVTLYWKNGKEFAAVRGEFSAQEVANAREAVAKQEGHKGPVKTGASQCGNPARTTRAAVQHRVRA